MGDPGPLPTKSTPGAAPQLVFLCPSGLLSEPDECVRSAKGLGLAQAAPFVLVTC